MRIRNTENPHAFQESLFKELGIYSLQGLLMDDNGNFTAAVEAVEYEDNEEWSIPFDTKDINAKFQLAKQLQIPFYIVSYYKCIFHISVVVRSSDNEYHQKMIEELNGNAFFASWWHKIKSRSQSKPLANGARPRANATIFDAALAESGLMWGGNIDGFLLKNSECASCIIDCISVSCNLDSDPYANPAYYFNSPNPRHGPRYEGWYPAVKLSHVLNIPHALLTLDKKNQNEEHVGMAFIRELSKSGLFFWEDISPNKNILSGKQNIINEFNSKVINKKAPKLVEQ